LAELLFCLGSVPHRFWRNRSNVEAFVLDAEQKLNLVELSDWYSVTRSQMSSIGGGGLVTTAISLYDLIKVVYPDYDWDQKKFRRVMFKRKRGYWQNIDNTQAFLKSLEDKLCIKSCLGWYRVSKLDVEKLGQGVSNHWPNIVQMLYPKHKWQFHLFGNRSKRAMQRLLRLCCDKLFTNYNIKEEYGVGGTDNNSTVSLDIYIPSLNLALEYQGEHHYNQLNAFGPTSLQQVRDNEKSYICKQLGITLVAIPYWWNVGDSDEIAATILHFRTDLHHILSTDALPLLEPSTYDNKQNVMEPGSPGLIHQL
jgi:hypothetical protein